MAPQVLKKMRESLESGNFSENVAKAYLYWARSYLIFNEEKDPTDLSREHVEAFLNHLAVDRYAASSTQNQALKAIQYLYEDVLMVRPEWLTKYLHEKQQSGIPNILSKQEIQRLLSHLHGQDWLVAALVYGSGLRLMECLGLRVRDLDFDLGRIMVRDDQNRITRETILPKKTVGRLRNHLEDRKLLHIKDIAEGMGETYLPPPVADRQPGVARSWGWQYLFPEQLNRVDPESRGVTRRHHVSEKKIRQAIERAAIEASIYKRVSGDTLRNSFAVHMIQQGVPMREVELLLGTGTAAAESDPDSTRGIVPMPAADSPLDRATSH